MICITRRKGCQLCHTQRLVSLGGSVNEPVVREGKDQRKFVTFRLAVNNQFGATEHAAFYNCTGNEYMANRINKGRPDEGPPHQGGWFLQPP